MELALTAPGEETRKTISLPDEAFAREFNEPLVHQAVVAYLAGARQGSAKQKNRAEVNGGGRKPWRQKGTGRARAGTIRSPIWRGGGLAFAARPRDYGKKLNRKMYRRAMQCIFSELIRQRRLVVVDDFLVETHKTRDLAARLEALELDNVLVVDERVERNLYLAARNLRQVEVLDAAGIDPVKLIGAEKVLCTVAAMKQIAGMLS